MDLASVCVVLIILSDLSLQNEFTGSECSLLSDENAQYCADLFDVSICNIAITKRMAWIRAEAQLSNADYDTLRAISTSLHEFRHVYRVHRYHYSYHNFIITILCYAISFNTCTVGGAIQMTVYNYNYNYYYV